MVKTKRGMFAPVKKGIKENITGMARQGTVLLYGIENMKTENDLKGEIEDWWVTDSMISDRDD